MRYITPPATTVHSITRAQSRVYRQAARQEPVTRNPAIGTIASMMSR